MVLHVRGPLSRSDLPGLYARICGELQTRRSNLVICDVGPTVAADAVAVDAVARLQLAGKRLGCRIQFRHVDPDLQVLLAMLGLADVVLFISH